MVKKILISGAANGLGFELANILSKRENCKLILLDKDEKLVELAGKLNSEFFLLDLSKSHNFAEDKINLDNIDYFINNASFAKKKNFDEMSDQQIIDEINISITSPLIIINNLLKKNINLKVINILSTTVFFPSPTYSIYSSNKTFIKKLFDNLTFEKTHNISYQNIYIGSLNTEFSKNSKKKIPEFLISNKEEVSKKISNTMFMKKYNKDYFIGLNANLIYIIYLLTPNFLFKKILVFLFKIMR